MELGIFPKDIWNIIFVCLDSKSLNNIILLNKTFNFQVKNDLLNILKKLHKILFDLTFKELIWILEKKENAKGFYIFGRTKFFYPLFITAISRGDYICTQNGSVYFVNGSWNNCITPTVNDFNYKHDIFMRFQKETSEKRFDLKSNSRNGLFFLYTDKTRKYSDRALISFANGNKHKTITLYGSITYPSFTPILNFNQDEFIQIPMTFEKWTKLISHYSDTIISTDGNEISFVSISPNLFCFKIQNAQFGKHKYRIDPRCYNKIFDDIVENEKISIRFQGEWFQMKTKNYVFCITLTMDEL